MAYYAAPAPTTGSPTVTAVPFQPQQLAPVNVAFAGDAGGLTPSPPNSPLASQLVAAHTEIKKLAAENARLKEQLRQQRDAKAVTTGYTAWKEALEGFAAYEKMWKSWGGQPIPLDVLLAQKKTHAFIPIKLNPAPLCDRCSEHPASHGCPLGLFVLECAERHFVCDQCYNAGYSVHQGIIGGKNREFVLGVMKAAFKQSDADHSGAIDFLEGLHLAYLVAARIPEIPESRRQVYGTLQNLKIAFETFASDEKLDLSEARRLFKETFRIDPPNLDVIFASHTSGGAANFAHLLWITYHVAFPDSKHTKHLLKEEKQLFRREPTTVEYRESDDADVVKPVPVFDQSKCKIRKMLGEGGLCMAWLIDYDGTALVAKVPKPTVGLTDKANMFGAARLQSTVSHRNVLRVLGVHDNATWPCILLELAEGGDLAGWQGAVVDRRSQWRALYEVAQGLNQLHTSNPPIIHRDLKAPNVFITKKGTCKVADFDFAATLEPPLHLTSGIMGTPGFMAPEMLANQFYGVKADVFSFGSLAYEVTHGSTPFGEVLEQFPFMDMEGWFRHVSTLTQAGKRPNVENQKVSPGMFRLIVSCWRSNPDDRPSMEEVCKKLEEIRPEYSS
eukprot:GGOE01001890.1.p1 GENE.GGOE01001890.1~~GGOE01001890.1.p1  ORF type:complete len:623 (-),score=192.86 GGOE01001890.1:488-2332(-)